MNKNLSKGNKGNEGSMATPINQPINQPSLSKRFSFFSPRSRIFYFLFIFIVSFCTVIFSSSIVAAQYRYSTTLVWDPVSGASGYRVHIGTTSKSYTTHYDAHATTSYRINGLTPGVTYYYAATAYNASGQESAFSNEVSYILGLNTAPITGQKIGVFRKVSGVAYWYFDNNGNGAWDGCSTDGCLGLFGGLPEDIPVVGNWDGTGVQRLGVYRKGDWFFDPNNSGTWNGCGVDTCISGFGGLPDDLPVVGDWNGSGTTKIGIYRRGQWFLDGDGNRSWDQNLDISIQAFGGFPEDVPVIGDWTGDGRSKIGIYRKGMWYLDRNGNGLWEGCGTDLCVGPFGGYDMDIPIVGDWTNTGISKIGIFRNGEWYLDFNGNGQWDDCTVGKPDRCAIPFGGEGDYPVVR
jgi:hypothetical protein